MSRILLSLACLALSALGRRVQGKGERRRPSLSAELQNSKPAAPIPSCRALDRARRPWSVLRGALKEFSTSCLAVNEHVIGWQAVGHAHRFATKRCRLSGTRLHDSLPVWQESHDARSGHAKAESLRAENLLGTFTSADTGSPKHIRFLISDTGGGHRASALALSDALEACFPGEFSCDVVDLYVESGRFPFCDYPAIYKQLAANPWAWKLIAFDFGASPFGIWFNDFITEIVCFQEFRRLLDASPRPDAVICVHPLLNAVPLKALADLDGGKRKTPFLTVVTDLGSAHPSWFDTGVDKCFVPSDVLHRFAQRRGLSDDQIQQFGLPIRRGFWTGHGRKDKFRDGLGLVQKLPTVLVVGGGDGVGGIVATAEAIGAELGAGSGDDSYQMVVICGRNQQALGVLESKAWPSNLRVTVLGFVDNMDEYMAAADLLVTKAGPGTIAEATAIGLPCVLNSYLPGQEVGNIDFVRNGGFGEYHSDPQEVARLTATYLADKAKLGEMAAAARRAGRPEATMRIADDIGKLLGVLSSRQPEDYARRSRRPQQSQSKKISRF